MRLGYCKVVSVNYKAGTTKIMIPDSDDQILEDVPLLAWNYDMPEVGSTVATLIEEHGGQVEKALILGPVYSDANKPSGGKKGLYYINLPGGANVRYESDTQTMSVSAKTIDVKNILYDTINKKG